MFFLVLLIGALSLLVIHVVLVHVRTAEKRKRSFAGKVVLVTGAGHGLGQELCLAFAREKCHIICVDINEQGNEETVKLVKEISKSIKVVAYKVDVTNFDEVQELGKKIDEEFSSGIDILINNAGIMITGLILEQKPKSIAKLMDVNVNAHFWMIQTFLPKMLKKDSGYIVGISSIAGKMPFEGAVSYCTSKYAVIGLMESLSLELRCMKANIKTITICPGFMATNLLPEPYTKPGVVWLNNMPIVILKPKTVARKIVTAVKEERRVYFNQIMYPIVINTVKLFPLCIIDWLQEKYLKTTIHIKKNKDI